MTSARERALRRRVREIWSELLRERNDHTRARRLLDELDRTKAALKAERTKGEP